MATIGVNIVGDASGLLREFRRSERATRRFQSSVERTGSKSRNTFVGLHRSVVGVSTALLGGAGLAYALHTVFEETKNVQKVSAQTRAVLKSTGQVAGVSARDVRKLAQQLSKVSGVSSTTIRASENLLLAFTNVRNVTGEGNDIFDQATLAALDMAAALGRDVPSAAKTLGKALQNPIRGVGGLRRANISFTKAQEKTIKTLVESGRMLQAQKIILRQVEIAYGGSAAAAGTTFAGKIDRLRNSLLELGVTIGTALLPVVTPLVDKMTAWLEKPKNKKKVIEGTTSAVGGLASAFEFLGDTIGAVNSLERKTDSFLEGLHLGFLTDPFKHARNLFDKDSGAPFVQPPGIRGPVGRRRGAKPPPGIAAEQERIKKLNEQARRGRIRRAEEAKRQADRDRAAFNVDRTQLTKTLTDDLAALRRYNALLVRQMKGGHKTLELEREQLYIQLKIQDILRQRADAHKKQQAQKKRMGLDVARFQKTARGQFVRAGARGGGSGVVIHGGVTLTGIHNMQQFERELQKRKRQRTAARRGNRG